MAKANSVTGTTWYIPEGGAIPTDAPEGVVLVGPGVSVPQISEADPKLTTPVKQQIEKEVSSSQPATTSSPSTAKTKNG